MQDTMYSSLVVLLQKKKNVKENSIRILEESRTITGSDFLKSMFLSQKTLMS